MFKISALLKTIVTFLFIVSTALQAGAVTDVPTTQNITGSQIAVNQDLTVTELVFGSPADRARINTSHPQLFKDVITLSVNERDPGFISAAFQVSVTFDISFTRADFTTGSINGITLTVNYDPASGATFVPIDYYHFEDAYEFTAHITSASSSIPGSVKLESSVTATRDYIFNENNELELVENLTHSLQTGSQELELIWDQMDNSGRTHYDVEWTWVHQEFEAMYQQGGEFQTDLIFTHNATRHTVSVDNVSSGAPGTEHYFVPLLYDGTGKLFYRVRPVQEQEDGQWIYGDWSCGETTTDYFAWTGHEPTLNWQASTSFAEDGVRKSVVQYADGSMRNRQTVTKDNETQTTIVAETKYDYKGRPAIQVLPAPTLSNVLQFTSNFNRFVSNVPNTNEKDIYDVTTGSVCDVTPAELDNTYSAPDGITGAAQYYSPNNPEKTNGFNQFIPDSKKYPYTQTLYEQNAGGRVLAQSGVGPDHVLNGAHDTRYYYSKPSQQILTALFGPEAGDASHYFKTTVRDANGQFSVSYSDMYGHTVATALAGRNIAGNNTDALSSYVDISNADQISEDMLSDANNHISDNAIISSSSLSVTTDQLYTFNYRLTPPQVSVACPENQNPNLCYDCAYNLEIRITNECGGSAGGPWNFENIHLTDPPGTDCDGSSPDVLSSFSVFLTEGNYTVTKTLTLNSAIQNYYLNEVYLPNNTCKTFESIYNQVLSQFQQDVVCTMTCASCTAALGTYEDYKTAYLQSMGLTTATAELEHTIQMSYDENKAICDALCETDGPNRLDVIEQLMLHDVSPQSGQFAIANPDVNFSYPQKSVFRIENGVLPYQTPLKADGTPGQYLNDSGEPDPNAAFFLSPVDFANKFNSTWAKSLLYYHPEYKKYQKAKQYLWDAFEWERHHLMHAETYAGALADPDLGISTNDIVENDPFYRDVASVSVKNAMIDKINSHFKKVAESPDVYLGMWQMAWAVVNCAQHLDQDGHMDINCVLSAPTILPLQAGQCPGDINKVWEIFRTWYITERMLDIDNYLNDGLTAVQTYYNSILTPNHYHRVFVRPGNINASGTGNQYEDLFNSASVGPDYGSGGAQDALQQHYTETCESYKLKWISDLMTCPAIADAVAQMTPAAQEDFFAQITDALKDICIAGSDPTHPLGSSSAAPDANAPYPDFPAALTAFFADKNISVSSLCHPYMITYPPTYDNHGSYGGYQAVFTQQNCACEKLEDFKQEKTDKQFGGTLSEFLWAYHHIDVSQATLDVLQNGCSGLDNCETFDPSLELPGIFNCGVTNKNCISCIEYEKLLDKFHTAFPELPAAPYPNPEHTDEQQANQVFQLFMNYKTGYNKNWTDYVRFGMACNSAQIVYSCQQLEGYEHEFRQNHGQAVGATCQADFLQYFNEQTANLYTWPDLEAVYWQACGRLPDICTPEISCSQFKTNTVSFFEWYHGLEDDPLPNCEASFVSYMNAQFGANFSSFSQYSNWYQVHCGETLDICEAYPCSIIRHVIDLYKATNQWMYSDCIDRFVSFFNAYFGSELIWDDIQPLLENCGDRFNICGAQTDCALVQDYITQFDPKSEPCTSILPEGSPERCAECLAQYLNSHFNVAYNYAQWQAIASTCGGLQMTCNPDLDCLKLTTFVTEFMQHHEEENNTDAQCQALFVSEFNSQYNLSYNLNQVLELYEVMCGAQPAICGFAPPLGPAQLNHFVDQFLKDFPNWQLGTDSCTSLFGKYFESFTGLKLSYDSIVRLYIRITGKAPEICTPKSCEDIQSFYNGYLADYPGSQLPLDMRKLILLNRWESFAGKVSWSELKSILNSCLIYPDTSQYPPPYLSCDHVQGVTRAFYELRPHQNGPNCTSNFMTFFNSYYGTSLTYQQLVDWAQNNCYLDFSVCGNGGESEEEYPLVTEAYAPVPHVSPLLLCDDGDPADEPEDDPCDDVTVMANNAAYEIFNHYVSQINNHFNNSYKSTCLSVGGMEHFTVSYKNPEFHYTLYYYNQAGNLVKTIPPGGVSADFSQLYYDAVKAYRNNPGLTRPQSPQHRLATSYRYNSLNEVVEQYSPDGGLSRFYYDKLGRVTLSQNGKQLVTDSYSYTIYDGLGRIEEVGETVIGGGITQSITQMAEDPSTLVPPERTEITHTGYDAAYISDGHFAPLFRPGYLRGRVSYSWVKDSYNDVNYRMGTFYSYDAHGNVKTLFHDYHEGVMEEAGNAFKRMDYEYDLISGKVKEVRYQDGEADAFYHRYRYDGENRLKTVETSRDKIWWQRDAKYRYYKHGPLARLEFGELQVQGVDYAYTLHGWLKGINSTGVGGGAFDMGADGKTGSSNSNIARDAYGVSLNYYEGDYKPIGSSVTPFAGIIVGSDLFNGNIKSMVLNIPKLGDVLAYVYRYDQLNRLTKMDAYTGLNTATNVFTPISINDYKERFTYSPEGSILTLERNGQGSNVIDNATWHYYAGTHRLEHINDPAGSHGFDAGVQSANNYTYSPIGEMTADVERGFTSISWNVYGKLTQQQLSDGRTIKYTYDAGGNRISKQLTGTGGYTEWYVRDAGGNVMSIYKKTDSLRQTELFKYGSSMLGIKHQRVNMEAAQPGDGITAFTAGETVYNLTDQRGNNLVTVLDSRTPHDEDHDGIVDYYTANIATAQDYSSFGSLLEGRQYNPAPRHTYNGKELDKETGWQDYGMRPYLVDVPIFGKVDPLTKEYPELTPYQFASNSPIAGVDLDGLEFYYTADGKFLGQSKNGGTQLRIATKWGNLEGGNFVIHGYKEYKTNSDETRFGRNEKNGFTGINTLTNTDLSYLLDYSEFVFQRKYGGRIEKAVLAESNAGPYKMATKLLDFKTQIYNLFGFDENSLISIDGVLYNANEAGNYVWGMVLTRYGSFLDPELLAESGSRSDNNRADESNDKKALLAGVKKADKVNHSSLQETIVENYQDELDEAKSQGKGDKFKPSNLLGEIKKINEKKQ